MVRKAGINVKIGADLKDFSTKMQNVSRQMKKMGRKFERLGKKMSRNVTLPLLALGAAAIKFSSDLQESINKSDVAFGAASESVKAFAKTTLESFGIAESSSLEMATNFGDMATSMGIAEGAAANMSTSLVGLAGDLASFKNIGISQAQTALAGIFTGETESLKKLGIVMTQANLQAFALTKGITKQVQKMTEAEKVNLRYAFILAKTANAQGDFERTGGNAANQMRIFQETLKEIAATFGNVILPIFTKGIKRLNKMLLSFRDLSPSAKKFRLVLLGITAAIGPLLIITGKMFTGIAAGTKVIKYFGNQLIILRAKIAALSISTLVMATQIILVTAAIAAVVLVIRALTKSKNKLTSAEKGLAEVQGLAIKQTEKEVGVITTLKNRIDDNLKSRADRLKAVKKLREIMPDVLKNLSDEEILAGKADTKIRAHAEAIIKRAQARAAEERIADLGADRAKESENIDRVSREVAKLTWNIARMNIKDAESIIRQERRLKAQKEVLDGFKAKKKAIQDEIDALSTLTGVMDEVAEKEVKPVKTPADGTGDAGAKKGPIARHAIQGLPDTITQIGQYVAVTDQATESTSGWTRMLVGLNMKNAELAEGLDAIINKESMTAMLADTFVLLGESIGQALGGAEDAFDSFLRGFASMAVGMIKQVGQMVVSLGALAVAQGITGLDKSKIGKGIGLMALGGAIIGGGAFVSTSINGSLDSKVRGEDIHLSGSRFASSKGRVR
jgi:hypothetical protein